MPLFPPRIQASNITSLTPLPVIVDGLKTMANAAQLGGVPYIQPIILLASAIIATIQQCKENTKAFGQLANDTYNMIQAIARVQIHSLELERNVTEFTNVLERVRNYVQEHSTRHPFRRWLGAIDDASKIQEYRAQIQRALEIFDMEMQMRTHVNIVLLLRQRSEMNASRSPPAYVPEDPALCYPTIPGNIRAIVEEHADRLPPILGVVGVFQKPPSVKQLCRILGLVEDEVQTVWGPISAYLEGLSPDEKTAFLAGLGRLVSPVDASDSLDPPTFHNLVAQWCLLGPTIGGKDISYASDFWVHHVCNSAPSDSLYDALTHSDLPLAPESRDVLPEIVTWIEKIHPDQEWMNLLSTYQHALSQPAPHVGGDMSDL
ncbi:hypothetical protein B0H15DRAFT_288721 [Mycena belliarum]|uniref:Uncharacterized protein n=1 Tax=Mycena belliarum TaxID=1033014 RepID=A0AAD6U3Y4_9AGAR|nr:hypothetical protein B0H15DRAFT_288721 [Mycena belliae]